MEYSKNQHSCIAMDTFTFNSIYCHGVKLNNDPSQDKAKHQNTGLLQFTLNSSGYIRLCFKSRFDKHANPSSCLLNFSGPDHDDYGAT